MSRSRLEVRTASNQNLLYSRAKAVWMFSTSVIRSSPLSNPIRQEESAKSVRVPRVPAKPEACIPANGPPPLNHLDISAPLDAPIRSVMDFLKSAVASAISKGSPIPYTFGDRLDLDQSLWTLQNGTKRVGRSKLRELLPQP